MPSQPKTLTTTSNATKGPLDAQMPFFQNLWGTAQNALNATNNNPFTGNFTAQMGPDFNNAVTALRHGANSGAFARGTADFTTMAEKTARGDYLRPGSNPFLQGAVNAAINPVKQTFQNTVLPGIQDASIAQGAYGGSGMGVAQGQAADALTRNIGDITSNMFYQNYANERQNQVNAGNMLQQGFSLGQLPGQALMGVADAIRQNQQLGLTNNLQKYQAGQTAPWYGLGEFANILGTGGFANTSGTETKPNPAYVDPFTNALKIALGVGSTVAGMGGSGGFNFWGPTAGMPLPVA